MKTSKLFIYSFLLSLCLVVSCEDTEETLKTNNDELLSFLGSTSYELSIPQEDASLVIPATVSTLSSQSRTYNVSVVSSTDGSAGEYAIGSIVVPANEYQGELSVDFDFSEIGGEDGDIRELVLEIEAPAGAESYNDVVSISYFREIVCNDLELTIISDVWASETYFTLEQADGTSIVERFFPYSGNSTQPQTYNVSFNLPDGDYVYKMGDSYGDGMVGTGGGVTLTGSYSLTCSIITHASGEGVFSPATPDPFTGAPNAIVEVTNFTVNP
ncbi:hypothetical protein [Winogradskyella flava]|uniref:DUF1735 domain-containing protein n=1 Tax=Winogradskyella flava TaxID=1884876 RepID=A0A842IWX9_9FLAO|nr:hypothetical protein [Winogradskyella flava]MBC2846504.1 hypothetical protein [Winogradskyella flava]